MLILLQIFVYQLIGQVVKVRLGCRWLIFALCATVFEEISNLFELRCIFQILIIVVTWSNNMLISVLSGGVDTVSEYHQQVPGSNPANGWFLFVFFKFIRIWFTWRYCKVPQISIGLRKYQMGYATTQRVTQIPNGLRKYPTGYATRDSSLPFSSHRSTEQDSL